jgi:hypothetical protein
LERTCQPAHLTRLIAPPKRPALVDLNTAVWAGLGGCATIREHVRLFYSRAPSDGLHDMPNVLAQGTTVGRERRGEGKAEGHRVSLPSGTADRDIKGSRRHQATPQEANLMTTMNQ